MTENYCAVFEVLPWLAHQSEVLTRRRVTRQHACSENPAALHSEYSDDPQESALDPPSRQSYTRWHLNSGMTAKFKQTLHYLAALAFKFSPSLHLPAICLGTS